MSRSGFLALASEPQETLLSAALQAHGIAITCLPLGARDLLPGCKLTHWRASLLPTLRVLFSVLGAGTPDEAARSARSNRYRRCSTMARR